MNISKAELVKQIVQLQRKADGARRQYELDIWMSLPLTIAQLKSLFFISDRGSTTAGKLAIALDVTPTNVTGIIDRLVKQDLVSRVEDAHDRRSISIRATEKGEDLLNRLRSRRTEYLSGVLDCMNMDDLAWMARGLSAFIKAAEAQDRETHAVNTLKSKENRVMPG